MKVVRCNFCAWHFDIGNSVIKGIRECPRCGRKDGYKELTVDEMLEEIHPYGLVSYLLKVNHPVILQMLNHVL